MIDYKKISCKNTLEKKFLQLRSIFEISFRVYKIFFNSIYYKSKEHNEVEYRSIRETVKMHRIHLQIMVKLGVLLLTHKMYVIGLKTGVIRLLMFEDVENKSQPIINIYDSKTNTIKHVLIS